MNRFKTLSKNVQVYLTKVHSQFTENKLSFPEIIQFFQDSVDTGYYLTTDDWDLIDSIHLFREEGLTVLPLNNGHTVNQDSINQSVEILEN